MKLEPHLPQLPSIGELLDHPRVKGVVARINRSTLAQRASGFLDELRSTLSERAGRVDIPSVTHLAERLARRLLGEPLVSGPLINATGVVVGDPEFAPPLADAAVHAMVQQASEYHERGPAIRHALERDLCRLTGADAALAVSSFDAALITLLASAAANREILVAEPRALLASTINWPLLAARSATLLRTCGGDSASIAAALAEHSQLAILVRSPETEGLATTEEVAAMAKRRGVCFIDAAPLAGVLNPDAHGLQSIETLQQRLAAGADVVVADGAGLIGGPTCGVIVGKRSLVESAAAHPFASLSGLDANSAAALHATLAAYREDSEQSAIFTVPVWQLLSSPLANLQQRAERLAALMSASPAVASATAREVQSPWHRCGEQLLAAQSWVIVVRPRAGDAASLLATLRRGPSPIVATEVDGAVQFDLRSVFPRWDQQLVAAIESADN